MRHIITMRDEDGTWYLDAVSIDGKEAVLTSISSERADAMPFYTEAYATKIAELCEAKWRKLDNQTFSPRGRFRVRSIWHA